MNHQCALRAMITTSLFLLTLSTIGSSEELDGSGTCLQADGCSQEHRQSVLLQVNHNYKGRPEEPQNKSLQSYDNKSLMSTGIGTNPSGTAAPLTQDGYAAVADRCCQAEMEQFIARVAFDLGIDVCSPAGIRGLAPFHTCEKGPQTYDALTASLFKDAEERCSAFALKGKCVDLPADCPNFPNTTTPDCHCSVSQAAKLDFARAFMGQNNLGGLGPDTGVEEMRYINIFAKPFPVRWTTHPEYCIDVAGGSTANGATVATWECVDDGQHFNMQWTLPPSGTGVIRWTPHPGKCFQVAGGSMAIGTNLEMWDCDETNPSQQFTTPDSGSGLIQWATHPEKCLEVDGGKTGNRVNIQMAECDVTNPNMQWTLPAVSDATDLVVTTLSDYVAQSNAGIADYMAKGFGALTIRYGTLTDFQFQFVESGTSNPRVIDEFHLAFFDLDRTESDGAKFVYGEGYSGYVIDHDTTLAVSTLSSGRTQFKGTAIDVPAPSDPVPVTDAQRKATVMFFAKTASKFQLTFGFEDLGGRTFGENENALLLFSGASVLGDRCAA